MGSGDRVRFDALVPRRAAGARHQIAVVDGPRRLTYAELHTLVERRRQPVRGAASDAGDAVTSQLPNGVEAVAHLPGHQPTSAPCTTRSW